MRWRVLALCLVAAPLAAQEDDRGFVQGLIEDAVSDLGREVRLVGFEGALSSRATVDTITIADADGIWLQLDDVGLRWDRGALLSGEIDIEELSAGRIVLNRLPQAPGGPDLPAAEATPFALPELPVSVAIDTIRAERIELSETILGETLVAEFVGAVTLADGAGTADLRLERIDGKTGRFVIDAGYSNVTRALAISLLAEEGPNGIAARLIDLPGRPPVQLRIEGDAPLDDFDATLALATDGTDRITGGFSLTGEPTDDPAVTDTRFAFEIDGDLRPFLADRFDSFFGATARLATEGIAHGDGRLTLLALTAEADQLRLNGAAEFDTGGWPMRIDLSGQVAAASGEPVRLPVSGAPLRVGRMALDVQYDAAQGDGWAGRFDIEDLRRPDVTIDTLLLTGLGNITPGGDDAQGAFTADLLFSADGAVLADPAFAEALGERAQGRLRMSRVEGAPLIIEALSLSGAGVTLEGSGQVNGPDERFLTAADLTVETDDFARFSRISGQDLSGTGRLRITGQARPFDGAFEGRIAADTRDLGIGIAQVDPLLRGQTALTMSLARDESGTRLDAFDLTGDQVGASGSAEITANSASGGIDATIFDLSLLAPDLTGSGAFSAEAETDSEGIIDLQATLNAAGAVLIGYVTATPQDEGYELRGTTTLQTGDLAPMSGLVGQRLGGALSIEALGEFETATGEADAGITLRSTNLRIGPAGLDALFRGAGRASAGLTRNAGGRLQLTGLTARFPNLNADGDVTVTEAGQTRADLSLRLADVGLFAPDFSGPATADVEAVQDASGWQVSGAATGPAGTTARTSGRVTNDGTLALQVSGEAPLGLANTFIAPRQISGLARFDLSVNGPPALRSISGPVTISGARLAAPTLGQAVEDISGSVALGGGTARIDLAGTLAAGGGVTLAGPVDMFAPFQAGLTARLNGITLREPNLYQTTANGTVEITGPLAGGATIRGLVDLGVVELRVPSSSVSALGELPEVTHLGARPAVRQTLDRAGLNTTPPASGSAGPAGRPYPLDIAIRAPSRIFLRGRGLDAELGGQLQLTGTTNDVVPIGQFSLVRGRLDLLGQRFELNEGSAQLQGDFTPFIRLVANTEARTGTTVSVIIEGRADAPEVRFESNPELPQDEVLAQLLFGRDMSSISPLQAVQLASAIATLSGRNDGGILTNLREGLDLDDFDITSDENGNAAVRAGKYISDNVYTDVTIGSDGTSEINLNLDVSDDVTARGSFESDGESSIGIFYERDY